MAGTVSAEIIRTRSSLLIQGKSPAEATNQFPGLTPFIQVGLQSFLLVPLLSRDQVIGVLGFSAKKPEAYSTKDMSLAERVGSQIAGAIDNARLFAEHKQAGIIIREQLDFLQVLIDTIPSPIFFKDREGRFLGCNKAWEQMNGLKQEQMVGKTVFEIAPPDLAAIYRAQDEELFLSGGVQVYETSVISVEGKKHNVIFNKATFNKADGTVGGLVGVVLDITEHKRAEEALRRSEEVARRLAQENATVAKIGRIISSTPDIEDIYERFAEQARQLIAFDYICISTVNLEKGTLYIPYVSGYVIAGRMRTDVVSLAGSFSEEAARTRSSQLIQTEDAEKVAARFPGLLPFLQHGFRSFMAIPLISNDQVIGVLCVYSIKSKAYKEAEVNLAEQIADQIAGAIANAQLFAERKQAEKEREKLIGDLQKTLSEVKTLKGIFPICASCKKIRDDKGYWNQVEVYIRDRSEAEFSHGICPDCMKKLYGDFLKEGDIKI
jgi:PAS domain S-box-containing protein